VYEVAEETSARLLRLSFTAPRDIIEQRLTGRVKQPAAADNSSAGLGVYQRMALLRKRRSVNTGM
jgi:hypothetical protein